MIGRLRGWWAARRHGRQAPTEETALPPIYWHAEGRLTDDRCETCGVLLFDHERVEVSGTFAVRDEDPLMGGLGLITATYCTTHAPEVSA